MSTPAEVDLVRRLSLERGHERADRDPEAAMDPARRRGAGDFQVREEVWISRTDDLLLDSVVVSAPRARGHPARKPHAEPVSISTEPLAENPALASPTSGTVRKAGLDLSSRRRMERSPLGSCTGTAFWLVTFASTAHAVACARVPAPVAGSDGRERALASTTTPPLEDGPVAVAHVRAVSPEGGGASPCVPAERASGVHQRMSAATGDALGFRRLTPLFPNRWPNPTGVVAYSYESRALPTGVVAYEIDGPDRRLLVAPLGAPVQVTRLQPAKRLGRDIARASRDEKLEHLAEAEEVLVEIVAGCRAEADTCDALAPYQSWFAANPTIGRHLTRDLGVAVPCLAR